MNHNVQAEILYSKEDADPEKAHWIDVMRTFLLYEDFVEVDIERRQARLNRLDNKLAQYLPESTFSKIGNLAQCAAVNQKFWNDLVNFQDFNFAPRDENSTKIVKHQGKHISIAQMHRTQAVLHSLVREWCSEGIEERNASFVPILEELQRLLPITKDNAYTMRVSVPGCGLARLPLEIVSLGYCCEANEYSMFMLTASHFILNGVYHNKEYVIYPWIERTCNVVNCYDTFRSVQIPDISAENILNNSPYFHNCNPDVPFPKFSMSAGDFVDIYGTESNIGQWNVVVTCFFIDTAPVVLDYIRVIKQMLCKGGYWINIGPLQYHWATPSDSPGNEGDERYDQSIELSWEELHHVIGQFGFTFLKDEWKECKYSSAKDSMLFNVYRTKLFVAQAPL